MPNRSVAADSPDCKSMAQPNGGHPYLFSASKVGDVLHSYSADEELLSKKARRLHGKGKELLNSSNCRAHMLPSPSRVQNSRKTYELPASPICWFITRGLSFSVPT
jgi:hypothetical protein